MPLFSWFKKNSDEKKEGKQASVKPTDSKAAGEDGAPTKEPQEPVPEPECPIYEYIKSHTQDGRLPDDFRIPWIRSKWAPGAQDGVFLYHMAPAQPNPDRERKILRALTMMCEENNGDYTNMIFDIFEEIEKEISIVRLYDEIIRVMAANQENLNLENLVGYGDWLICNGISLLSVKLGLTVLAPFRIPFVEEVMMEFGVYDEFTYYAARVLSGKNWPNGNEELFRLAKSVRGWGRIHAVAYLRPETPEIRDWLLYEGADNDILPQYSADTCLQKAGAESRLDAGLTAGEFAAIGKLIQAALEPGPGPGVTDGDRILPKFLAKGDEYPIHPELKKLIVGEV